MIAITEVPDNAGMWGFLAVLVTQVVILLNQRRSSRVAKSTNNSVNNIDKDGGELTMIAQVREHGRMLHSIRRHQDWSVGVLHEVARQAGVTVPPLPKDDEEAA
jgi:hypothetical protein